VFWTGQNCIYYSLKNLAFAIALKSYSCYLNACTYSNVVHQDWLWDTWEPMKFKRIVHSENENSVSTSSCSRLVWVSFLKDQNSCWPLCLDSMKEKSTMEVNGQQELFGWQNSSKYLLLCSTEQRNSYKFRTTWGWVNDDKWTIPLIFINIKPGITRLDVYLLSPSEIKPTQHFGEFV